MRRLAMVFALIAMLSAVVRLVTPVAVAKAATTAQSRFRRAVTRACLAFTKRLRPLLPQAN
jgi:hypothetical protein